MTTEQFRNDFLCNLSGCGLGEEVVDKVIRTLDIILPKYNIGLVERLPIPWQTRTFEILKYYLASCKTCGYAKETLKTKYLVLRKLFIFCQKPLTEITALDIRKHLYDLQNSRKITNITLEKYRQCFNAFFSWCVREEFIDKNPCEKVKAIKGIIKRRESLTQMDLEYLRSACKDLRETALLELLYSTGCRIGEVANIKLKDVNWQEDKIVVLGKGGKERLVYLNAKAKHSLVLYLETRKDDCEYLITTKRKGFRKCTVATLRKCLEGIAKRVEDKISTKVIPHKLRHTTATQALKNGMPIEKVKTLLGHKSIGTTLIYADVDQTDLQNEHSKCVI